MIGILTWFLEADNGELVIDHTIEVVRCRDCSYYEHGIYTFFGERKGEYHCCSRDWNGEPGSSEVEPDGFCAWGERKVEE